MSRTEADEQKTVIQWCILMEGRWPELEYIYHVPNGGSRNAREAAIKTIQEYLCLWQGERLRCDTGKEYPIIR